MHNSSSFQTKGGDTIFTQIWTPEQPPKAVICISHGHGEHSGRYEHLAHFFRENGLAVFAMDHIGHGKSSGKQGYVSSYDALLDSIGQLVDIAKEQYPDLPCFLYGHSMGGNIVCNYAMRRNPSLQGVILASSWFRLAFEPSKFDLIMSKVMMRIYPTFTQKVPRDYNQILRDPEMLKQSEADTLSHRKMGPILFSGMVESGEWALEHAEDFALPLLVMHGSGDLLIDYNASKEFAAKVKGDVKFLSWEGFYHELHNEAKENRMQVMGAMLDWVEKKLGV